jgi:hypothetical protein
MIYPDLAIKNNESKFLVASYIFGDLLEFSVAFAEFYCIFRVFLSKFGDFKTQKTPNFRHFENKIRHLTIFRPKKITDPYFMC